MQPQNKSDFEPDWKKIFVQDFCHVCKKEKICPQDYACKDMLDFIDLNEEEHVCNGNSTKEIRS